jgi:hypothetical protein
VNATERTYWNGEPAVCRKVWVTVADWPDAPKYWARDLVGQRREAVEVVIGPVTFYIDDHLRVGRIGEGWAKVTVGRGSPRWSHGGLAVEPGSVELREEAA